MLEKLYKKLYTKIGGRPWTDIVREDQKSEPLLFILVFFLLGIMVSKLVGKRCWWIVISFLCGIVTGHFWW